MHVGVINKYIYCTVSIGKGQCCRWQVESVELCVCLCSCLTRLPCMTDLSRSRHELNVNVSGLAKHAVLQLFSVLSNLIGE